MASLRLDLDGSLGQIAYVAEVPGGEPAGGPLGGGERRLVEVRAGVDPCHDLVVVPPDGPEPGAEGAHGVDHLVGGAAVAHEVPQNEHGVEALAPGPPQDGLEGVPVGVHVGEDQIAHYGFPISYCLPIDDFAINYFPISRAILAATSSGRSLGATSIVLSARR